MKGHVRLGLYALCALAIVGLLLLGTVVYRATTLEAGVIALKAQDYETSWKKLKPLAMVGDDDAQHLIGRMYAYGWGVEKDRNKALYWLRRAGKWTTSETDPAAAAAFYIAKEFAEGVGSIHKNPAEAREWFEIASSGGSQAAAEELRRYRTEEL